MSKSKDKGTRYENKVRDALRHAGIQAERSPQVTLGQSKKELDADVVIGTLDRPFEKVECKFRSSVPVSVYNWLNDNNFLVMKKIGKQYQDLVVMDLDRFLEMYWIAYPHARTKETSNNTD